VAPLRISAFEVPPGADERFLGEWTADAATVLYRALRPDADFRFVSIGPGEASPRGHTSVYEIVREDGKPDTAGGVVVINPFEVADGDDERFLDGWDRARTVLELQRGYIGRRLHRSTSAADFRYVDVARWSSPLMFARALDRPDFQDAARAIPFRSHAGLYLPVS